MKPQITLTDPQGLIATANPQDIGIHWSTIATLPPKVLPWFVAQPSPLYVELLAKVNGRPEKSVALWCSPFAPWFYVIYEEFILEGTNVELIIRTHKGYPK